MAWLALCAVAAAMSPLWLFRDKPEPVNLPDPCRLASFENTEFLVCAVDPASYRVSLHLNDRNGVPWRSLERFAKTMRPVFATNAGMYHEDLSPVGLYAEEGRIIAPLRTGAGEGNFFMQPNGVFGISQDGNVFVETTAQFAKSGRDIWTATQSGPMLLIEGAIHPRFEPDGASRHVRNGVGIDRKGRAVFAISRQTVSLGRFARLFRDKLDCENALYFDGVVSAFADTDSIVEGGGYPSGPIVGVYSKP